MATVNISTTGVVPAPDKAPQFQLVVDAPHPADSKTYSFMYGPSATTYDNFVNGYATIDRPGRPPLFVQNAKGLPTFAFTITLARLNNASIEPEIIAIRAIAQAEDPILIKFGDLMGGLWRCSASSVNVTMYNSWNHACQATVDLTFTRVSNAAANAGPTSGGVKAKPTSSSSSIPNAILISTKKVAATYTAKQGDTLFSVALRQYGSGNDYSKIADYNNLTSATLTPGQVLKLP